MIQHEAVTECNVFIIKMYQIYKWINHHRTTCASHLLLTSVHVAGLVSNCASLYNVRGRCRHRVVSVDRCVAPEWPRLIASLHTSTGGWRLSLHIWSSHCRPSDKSILRCRAWWAGVLCSMAKIGVVTSNCVFHVWRKTSLVCNINIPDVILLSDAEYLSWHEQ